MVLLDSLAEDAATVRLDQRCDKDTASEHDLSPELQGPVRSEGLFKKKNAKNILFQLLKCHYFLVS